MGPGAPRPGSGSIPCLKMSAGLLTEVPNGIEIVTAVGPKRDQRARIDYARKLRDATGDHISELLVLAYPYHRDDVGVAGYRIDLTDPFQLSELGGQVRHSLRFSINEHEGVDHAAPRYPRLERLNPWSKCHTRLR